MGYYRRYDGLVYEGDMLPDSVEISRQEFMDETCPTDAVKWQRFAASLFNEELREYLYQNQRHFRLDDDVSSLEDASRPFLEGKTVDELTEAYMRYLGDDDQKAAQYLAAKKTAKDYIRQIVQARDE